MRAKSSLLIGIPRQSAGPSRKIRASPMSSTFFGDAVGLFVGRLCRALRPLGPFALPALGACAQGCEQVTISFFLAPFSLIQRIPTY